jgi:hypothetical protein
LTDVGVRHEDFDEALNHTVVIAGFIGQEDLPCSDASVSCTNDDPRFTFGDPCLFVGGQNRLTRRMAFVGVQASPVHIPDLEPDDVFLGHQHRHVAVEGGHVSVCQPARR